MVRSNKKFSDLTVVKTDKIGEYGYPIYEYKKDLKMDEVDYEDWIEQLKASSNLELVELCEYELRAARSCITEEESDIHYRFADLACTEMEFRGMV